MGQVIRVSLPSYNALTDNNPDHFALYSDEDWVLIKELTRGSISATSAGVSITHNLGYIPTVFVYYKDGNIWKSCTGENFDPNDLSIRFPYVFLDSTKIYLIGNSGSQTDFKYFICYDRQV